MGPFRITFYSLKVVLVLGIACNSMGAEADCFGKLAEKHRYVSVHHNVNGYTFKGTNSIIVGFVSSIAMKNWFHEERSLTLKVEPH